MQIIREIHACKKIQTKIDEKIQANFFGNCV